MEEEPWTAFRCWSIRRGAGKGLASSRLRTHTRLTAAHTGQVGEKEEGHGWSANI